MKSMTLSRKILLIVAPLYLMVLVVSFFLLSGYLQNQIAANKVADGARAFREVSKTIHEVQKARGMSAMFLNGKLSQEELDTQRKKASETFANARTFGLLVDFDKKEEVFATIEADITKVRESVNSKAPVPEVLKKYGELIETLISLQRRLFERSSFEGKEGRIKSLVIFEQSKEQLGRLRAFLNGAFASNAVRDTKERDNAQKLMTSFMVGFESPGLIVNQSSLDKISTIVNSAEWKKVISAYDTFLAKNLEGNYGVDASDFFKAITFNIDEVNSIIMSEVDADITELESIGKDVKSTFFIVLSLVILVLVAVSIFTFMVIRNTVKEFMEIGATLGSQSQTLDTASTNLSSQADQLSQATTEQAASLQETSASIEEVSTMILNTKDNAQSSMHLVDKGTKIADEGLVLVTNLKAGMTKISESNATLLEKVSQSMNETESILTIIGEINTKTAIINDIVFQTRLLSFNASVEAARAGEHGKGFAVVAEEIGKLAQVSGQAANEITEMLSRSTVQVKNITESTKSTTKSALDEADKNVQDGIRLSNQSEKSFSEIARSIQEIAGIVRSINLATEEQSTGVGEVTKAIAQLDQVAQQNAQGAQMTAKTSEDLQLLSKELEEQIQLLNKIVGVRN